MTASFSTATSTWINIDTGAITLTSALTNEIGSIQVNLSAAAAIYNGDGTLIAY